MIITINAAAICLSASYYTTMLTCNTIKDVCCQNNTTQHALLVCLVKVSQQGAYQWRFLRLRYSNNILNAVSITGLFKTVSNNISICNYN